MARPNTVALPTLQGDLPDTMVQRTVPANSVFDVGRSTTPGGRSRPCQPEAPDLDHLVIRTDRPLDQAAPNTGIGRTWAALWARMPVGGSVDLTTAQANSFVRWAGKRKHAIAVRKLDNETCAVWRKG